MRLVEALNIPKDIDDQEGGHRKKVQNDSRSSRVRRSEKVHSIQYRGNQESI